MALTEIGSNFGYVSKSTKSSPKFEAHLLGKDLFKSTKVKKTKCGNSYFGQLSVTFKKQHFDEKLT